MEINQANWLYLCLAKWDEQCRKSNEEYRRDQLTQDRNRPARAHQSTIREISHFLSPWDTLEGLSLLYNAPIDDIKKRNNLSSNEIYYLQKIIIPNPQLAVQASPQQQKNDKIYQVMTKLKLSPDKEPLVRRLLEENLWNVRNTVKKYKADLEWERKYSHVLKDLDPNKAANSPAPARKQPLH